MIKTRPSLAVKYRPTMFEQFIGQDEVIDLLRGQFKSKFGINRSFMLTGPSGSGKTTLARMMAHYANCENFDQETCEPCWECSYCQSVQNNIYPDVEEINFSDTRGIDVIRNILESANYDAQYNLKVYILDELQGITSAAQNALLKFLEEPPEHVLILLLTTDPHKILDTVKNRCCPLNLYAVADEVLIGFLQQIVKLENKLFPIKDLVYRRIVMNAKGQVRQAVSALEAIIYTIEGNEDFDQDDELALDNIIGRFVDTPETSFFQYLIGGIYQGKYAYSLQLALQLIANSKSNFVSLFSNMLEYHMQSVFLLVDPKKNYPTLTDPSYSSWYNSLIETAKEGNLLLTPDSAAEISLILLDFVQKIGTYQFNLKQLFLTTTIKMLQIVHASKDSNSIFQAIYGTKS